MLNFENIEYLQFVFIRVSQKRQQIFVQSAKKKVEKKM